MTLALQPQQVLKGRYRIVHPIGQGGMGAIYLAEDMRLEGRQCAVKEVQTDTGLPERVREQSRAQFYREASVLARLDHPNLPKVSDFFAEDTHDYLVMDYVPGRDLKALIDEARQNGRFLPEADVLDWTNQILDALQYLHEQNPPILHRDIKPSNVKVTPSGLIKLVDFGLVKVLMPDERTVTIVQGLGTVHYTPLEQYGADNGVADARSDIYSFGATLYHLMCNEPPPEAKQRFLRPEALRPPRAFNPNISPRTEKAITWAMAMHPDGRPQNVAALREMLKADATGPTLVDSGDMLVLQPTLRLPYLNAPLDRYLAAGAGLLFLLAFVLTFLIDRPVR
jgi:serine/threonine-protein kinase